MKMFSDDTKIPFAQYAAPTMVLAGHGSLASISREVIRLGGRRAFILTDAGVRQAGLTQIAQDALGDFCAGIFDDIAQDTDLATVDAAVAAARENGADIIVSVGGGSVIDTAKAVCVTLKNGGRADDHVAMMRLGEPQIPHIVIPTTSGTGSEVTNVAVIKSSNAGRKVYIIDGYIIPNTAILDPRFTLTLPAGLTASTAMDAMTHAVEALTSTMSNPICDGHALQAIRMIRENLPLAVTDGRNEQARSNLQLAATMAGWAFSIAQVGLDHAMAHTLGMLSNVPHGTACGILLPAVMRFNVDFATDKLALAAQALGVSIGGMDKRDAALAAADKVEELMKKTGHPMKLSEVGVTAETLDMACFHALGDAAALFNARPVAGPEEVLDLYKQVY